MKNVGILIAGLTGVLGAIVIFFLGEHNMEAIICAVGGIPFVLLWAFFEMQERTESRKYGGS